MTRRQSHSLGYDSGEGPEAGSSIRFWVQKKWPRCHCRRREGGKRPGWMGGSERQLSLHQSLQQMSETPRPPELPVTSIDPAVSIGPDSWNLLPFDCSSHPPWKSWERLGVELPFRIKPQPGMKSTVLGRGPSWCFLLLFKNFILCV